MPTFDAVSIGLVILFMCAVVFGWQRFIEWIADAKARRVYMKRRLSELESQNVLLQRRLDYARKDIVRLTGMIDIASRRPSKQDEKRLSDLSDTLYEMERKRDREH